MRVAGWIGLTVMGAGLLVLWGWAQDIDLLKTFRPDLVPMRANAAAGFVLCGASLWLRVSPLGSRVPRLLANGCAGLAGAIALLTLLEYAFGWTPGIDQMLVTDPSGSIPGRMAVMTAVDFVLLVAALGLLDVESPRGLRPSNWLALGIAANAFLAILGYLYDVEVLYRISAAAAMALHTAILFVLASVGVALAPRVGLRRPLPERRCGRAPDPPLAAGGGRDTAISRLAGAAGPEHRLLRAQL